MTGRSETLVLLGSNFSVAFIVLPPGGDGTVQFVYNMPGAVVELRLADVDGDGRAEAIVACQVQTVLIKWVGPDTATPQAQLNSDATLRIAQNAPNPFNPQTTIRYSLPTTVAVSLRIFDVQGRLVRTLVDAREAAGDYAIQWDGKDDHGLAAGSGTYFYRLDAGGKTASDKMVLAR